jgi:hypothetical protein
VLRDLGLDVVDGRTPGELLGISPDVEGLTVAVGPARDGVPPAPAVDRTRSLRVVSDCVRYSAADDAHAGRD